MMKNPISALVLLILIQVKVVTASPSSISITDADPIFYVGSPIEVSSPKANSPGSIIPPEEEIFRSRFLFGEVRVVCTDIGFGAYIPMVSISYVEEDRVFPINLRPDLRIQNESILVTENESAFVFSIKSSGEVLREIRKDLLESSVEIIKASNK